MPYVEATGAKLYFEESGHGYPIIFIHEFASDIRGWEAQVRYFSRSYRCIAYNARGYPPSDVPEDASLYRWQFAVDDVAVVMRDLKIERAHLVGLSMGWICCPAVWVALSGKSQRDCRSKRGVWLSSLPA
jgi:pimeloyl-ACP methyl ester carboxylesterase